MRLLFTRLVPLFALLLALLPTATPARAQEYGYLWSLFFDFEKSFDGVLTIEVGPWENGDLVSVDETSTAIVPCQRVGNISLDKGDAVFAGGYLKCDLDLAGVVDKNHGLQVDQIDDYGSIILRSNLATSALNVAPLFSHPDATYQIDFTQTWNVTMSQAFTNGVGPQQQTMGITVGYNRFTYSYLYNCVWLGPCSNKFMAGPLIQNLPSPGGRIEFRTEPTTFLIGSDNVNTFQGRMGSLLIDPGNSVH
jgi:hypothetical protein